MNTIKLNRIAEFFTSNKLNPVWLLLIGVILMTLSHLTWNIDLLAWVSMVPFLLFLNITKGVKSKIQFVIFLTVAWSFIVLKIITEPIPYFLIPLYSIPIAFIHLPGYLLYSKFRSHTLSVVIFPAMMVVMEWVQYTFTPFASWGVASYTQVNSINISQGVSIFGMAGLSFLLYWTNAAITNLLIIKKTNYLNCLLPIMIIMIFSIYGHLRLDISKTIGKETIKVAAIGTDSELRDLPLPDFESNVLTIKTIFDRTEKAAELGAKIIVWNEAAFYLLPENETIWIDSISNLAKKLQVGLTASYVLPISTSPFLYENKYVLFDPKGEILNEYLKHEPVPGEPAIKGSEEIITSNVFGSNIGGAICYDYDFPYLAKENMQANADIIALPSSDWRGIDPLHTQMAGYRAIEQGHSIIRSTRFGLSAIISPYGEITAQMSSFNNNDKILVSNTPKQGIKTLYALIGDTFVYINIGFILLFLLRLRNIKFKVR